MKDFNVIHICGPDWIEGIGPLVITFHHYMGPTFEFFNKDFYPNRFNPVWILFRHWQKKHEKVEGEIK